MEFDKTKKYTTERLGDMHFIGINDLDSDYPVVMASNGGILKVFSMEGLYRNLPSREDDLREITPYHHLKDGDLVKIGSEKIIYAYFAKVSDNGDPMVYPDGRTKITSKGRLPVAVIFCELAEEIDQ